MNKIETPNIPAIKETVEKIKKGELKVIDLVTQHINRAKETNKDLNALISILEDEAISKAKKLDDLIEKNDIEHIDSLKLFGIPFTAKDLYLVKDTKTTFGSRYMEEFIAPYTSTVLQKCLDQGGILIAKANCDPWGFGGSGENSGFGPTRNPYDLERTPGGSSSGSAASLAAGVGFFSLGTDTGGSVRLPASYTNLYGLKPTYGRNSRYGIGVMGSSFDTPGFFTRNLEDMALLENIMAGKDELDSTTFDIPVPDYTKAIGTEVQSNRKLTIGLAKEFFTEGVDPEIKAAIDKKINELKAKGYEIKEVSLPSTEYALAVYYILVPAEISSNRARYDGVRFGPKVSKIYEENLIEGRSQFFEDEVKRRIMIGTYSLSAGYSDQFYHKASKVRTKIKREFEKVFREVDILISPVSPFVPFKLGERIDNPVAMYLVDVFSVTANIVGIPAMSIPLGFNSNDLPIGMQIMGKHFEEEKLFELAQDI